MNKSLFNTTSPSTIPSDSFNEAGGVAYSFTPKHKLAQFAATGCFNSTYYASGADHLAQLVDLASRVDPEFVAKVALYTRTRAHMKDTPALLVALLSVTSPGLMTQVFDRVIDTPKMLRNFIQIMRSGVVARRSLGSLPKRLVLQWLESRSDEQLFRASVGNAPSFADILRMVHPRPHSASRAALFAYILGKDHDSDALPALVKNYESFKVEPSRFTAGELPDVPMEMLTSLALTREHWRELSRRVSWQTLRMNLATFTRHDAFRDPDALRAAAAKLRAREEVEGARVFPYQLMAAYMNAGDEVPGELKAALQDAMESAIANVPELPGKVWIFPDVSGSMQSPVTGHRKGSTSKVRCVDVAALVAAAVLRRNPGAGVLPFSDDVVKARLNPRDSVMTNADRLARLPSGGTNCSAPLRFLNQEQLDGDLIIYVSDNQSWVDSTAPVGAHRGTATMEQWELFKRRNRKARLVCIDIQPYATTQASDRADILNIGGFSDSVFAVIAEFLQGGSDPNHWVSTIEKVSI